MISVPVALFGFFFMLGLMALGLHVAVAMFLTSLVGVFAFMGPSALGTYGTQLWSIMDDFLLATIPLFVLLGELLLRSGITDRMYNTLSLWLSPLPGGLLHSNIGTSAVFSAVSGSSVATAATITTVALPEFRKRRYNEKLVLGSIASGATLGILIPPSVNLIIFGAMTNTSIGELFIAGIIPGICLTLLFMLAIIIIATIWSDSVDVATEKHSMTEKVRSLVHLAPPAAIFFIVMGALYGGWATPTEAAGIGVLLALAFAGMYGGLSWQMLHESFRSTMLTSALCLFIISAAFYLNFIIGVMGVPQAMTSFVGSLGLSQLGLILVLVVFYLVLGCFIETLSMMVGTVPIVFPIILYANIDPIWFGIFLVLLMELALITPPLGMNLYVVQGVRGSGNVSDLFIGVLPFVGVIFVFVAIIIAFPGIITWLPRYAFQ